MISDSSQTFRKKWRVVGFRSQFSGIADQLVTRLYPAEIRQGDKKMRDPCQLQIALMDPREGSGANSETTRVKVVARKRHIFSTSLR